MRNMGLAAAMLLAATSFATPAAAQRSAARYGNYTDVSAIHVLPGQWENYLDFVKTSWVKQQEWAKHKGYIVGYSVVAATYPREGEPNLLLITEYKDIPSQAEAERRQNEYVSMMKMDEHQMDSAAVTRAPMRTLGSQEQYQEILLK
ncbi:MAG: hypothetical protein H0X36_07810 [Sphingomonadaceae bacterium]|nr:hypothetical protein [Sphingomonadaceae bacterium]